MLLRGGGSQMLLVANRVSSRDMLVREVITSRSSSLPGERHRNKVNNRASELLS